MNIALIGPSGVGKGTHANELVTQFNLMHLVTGELLREKLADKAAVGLLAKRYITRGELVPDEVVDAMVEEWLWQAPSDKGVLFDGFPRTVFQAEFLDNLFKKLGRQLASAIYLKVSDEVVKERLAGRIICRNCQTPYHLDYNPPMVAGICNVCGDELYQRPDDIPELIRVRLRAFHRVTGPLLNYYQETGRLVIIDGEGDIDAVSRAIIRAVEAMARQETNAATREEAAQIVDLHGKILALPPEQATHPSLDIVLVGGPGSGKGTQAEQLKNELNLPHIASGDLFREHLKNETDLGKLAKSYMDRGELVPDDVTEAMVEERISRSDASSGFILDGFPRTLPQAQALTEMMNHMQRRLDGVLYIRVSDEEIVRRLSGRLICRDCQTPYHKEFKPPAKEGICDVCGGELYQRDDDNPRTVRARLKTYHTQTAPIISYYRDTGLLVDIDGEGELPEVSQRTLTVARNLVKP